MYTIFGDWLDVIIASLAGDGDTYNSLVEKYQNQHGNETVQIVFELYAEAFGELVIASESTGRDILGESYERFRLTSDQFAQHFTPEPICQVLARMSIPDKTDIRRATVDDPLQIGDPTCGSGRLLIATARHLRDIAPSVPVLFVGQDIDSTCARMAVINFSLHDTPGIIIQGDSLTEEVVRCWRIDPVSHSENGWPIQRISPDKVSTEAD
jgi:type I restriction-modification system DNA methylase subunit